MRYARHRVYPRAVIGAGRVFVKSVSPARRARGAPLVVARRRADMGRRPTRDADGDRARAVADAAARLDAIARGEFSFAATRGGGAARDGDDGDARVARALEAVRDDEATARAFDALRAIEGALEGDESASEDGWDGDARRDAGDGFGDDSSDDRDDDERNGREKKGDKGKARGVGSSDGRLRMRGPIEMEGEEYAGRSASRRDFARDEPEAARGTDDDESDDEDAEGGSAEEGGGDER